MTSSSDNAAAIIRSYSQLSSSTIIHINRYYNTIGASDTANLMLGFILLSVILQLIVVTCVHYKNKRRTLIEIAGTLTFTKPAFNKWRVLTNAKMEGHEMAPPVSEMMMFKACEVFAESIPVTVLQVHSLLKSKELDVIVLLALLTSAVFVSEAVTYMTFMKDINIHSRSVSERHQIKTRLERTN